MTSPFTSKFIFSGDVRDEREVYINMIMDAQMKIVLVWVNASPKMIANIYTEFYIYSQCSYLNAIFDD